MEDNSNNVNNMNPVHLNSLTDQDLQINLWLELVATKQDKQAFAALFKNFAPKIRAHGLKRFGVEAQAMDLVQETMFLVWKKAGLFNFNKGKASTWIYTIMRNHCFDMLRKIKSKKEDAISDDLWPTFEGDCSPQDTDHLQSRRLLMHLDSLPASQKEVVNGIYIKEMTQQELALHLDLPLGTIKSRLRLAMSKLREKMEECHD
ncbi:MAG: sigma-70 family RNA polymerase sigma factor [Psychromonas sp.]